MNIDTLEYNTQRSHLKLKEYGRNVQKLVVNLKDIEDKGDRSKKAATLVQLMKRINSQLNKSNDENDQKVWDDLHVISNFELDLDGAFPKPDPVVLSKKPERLKYYSNEIKFRHYGRGVELLINQAIAMEDPKEQKGTIIAIGKLMKNFSQAWNKDTVEDELILKNIKKLSDNKLDIDIEIVKELGLFNLGKRQPTRKNYSSNNGRGTSKPTLQRTKIRRNINTSNRTVNRSKS